MTPLVLGLWASGTIVVVLVWAVRWLRLRAVVRAARPLDLVAPVPVRSTAERIEPSLVGIWRPVLLLPEEIPERLSPEELRSIIAHEVCHLHRHDNLTAAVHLVVEAVFCFYPLTWWLGTRLLAERERACDEAVVASGHAPQVYAEGILKVCRLYIRAPLASTASVAGANLRKRVEEIMNHPVTVRMGAARRLLLVAAGVAAVVAPVAVGLLSVPALGALAASGASNLLPTEVARQRGEQSRPQKEIPYNPEDFGKFVGYYQLAPRNVLHVFRKGDRYFSQLAGQPAVEWFPESPDEFFTKQSPIRISFTIGARGNVKGLFIHKNGRQVFARRTSAAVARKEETAIRKDLPKPGTRAKVLGYIEALEKGVQPDYNSMTPQFAAQVRAHLDEFQSMIRNAGEFRSLTFKAVSPNGLDSYVASFAHGRIVWLVAPLTANGRISDLKAVPVPVPVP